jgi:hypothetical protein
MLRITVLLIEHACLFLFRGAVYVDALRNLIPESVRCRISEPALPEPRDIIYRNVCSWGIRFYVRVDPRGCFYTHPDVGGPFQSVDHALDAIDRYLLQHKDEICPPSVRKYKIF